MNVTFKNLELDIDTKHIYIKIGSWDYWKQWASTDIN